MYKYLSILLCLTLLTGLACVKGQDSSGKSAIKEIDPSKPTNLYTQLNAGVEYQHEKNETLYGPRINVQYALNANNLILVEMLALRNSRTGRFGITDTRTRYFKILKRNISKKFIALGTLLDVTAPTGSFENGLGSSSWTLSAGTIFGLLLSKKLSLFPGLSYVHITKPASDKIPPLLKHAANGLGLQFNCSYRFNKTTFMFINPLPTFLHINGNWSSNWAAEFSLNKIVKPNKVKVNLGYNPNFTTGAYALRFGTTFFL
ncbi:MAG: hypothetical protein RL172_1458 [Bacteroidota bacterium]|jgi:hypothetical protein